MDSAELGRRIKEARINRKMTQAELVGNFITRNMLSQIESGNATPSVKTLEYIASKLELPVSSLVPEERKTPQDMLSSAKDALKTGDYDRAVSTASKVKNIFYDEYVAISAKAYIEKAKSAEQSGDFAEAAKAYKKACDFAGKGIYANKQRKSDAALGLQRTAQETGE